MFKRVLSRQKCKATKFAEPSDAVSSMSSKSKPHERLWMVAIGIVALGLAGCSSNGSANTSGAPPSNTGQSEDDFRPPVPGETMAEVHAQYDDPDQVFQTSDGGEAWVYVFGKGKLFIPFYGPYANLRTLTIQFDPNGRVVHWESGGTRHPIVDS